MTQQEEQRPPAPRRSRPPRRLRITWEQFTVAWKLALGSGILGYGVIVTAERAPTALPWVLLTGAGLVGLTITIPWERRRGDDEE